MTAATERTAAYYKEDNGREPVKDWLDELRRKKKLVEWSKVNAQIKRAEKGNFAKCRFLSDGHNICRTNLRSVVMTNKNRGSKFSEHLTQSLREDDDLVFLHIKEALENPDLHEKNDYSYLIEAINDVAVARGKSELAQQSGISRQGLHKILIGKSAPSIQNITAILNAIGLKFSVEQIQTVITDSNPANVLDVAEYAVTLMPRSSTYMKLQKIVYYAQVESLMHFSRPLFKEKICAWQGGPVVRELFDKHKGCKQMSSFALGDISKLSLEQKTCVNWAIEKYCLLDGDTLSHLTHLEDPWKSARSNRGNNNEITIQSMVDYYSKLPKYSDLEEQDISAH